MKLDAILEALSSAREAREEVNDNGYGLEPDAKEAVLASLDVGIEAFEEAARLAVVSYIDE